MTFAHVGEAVPSYSGSGFGTDWLYLVVPLLVIAGVVVYLVATGNRGEGRVIGLIPRASASLERDLQLPAWSAGGVALGGAALVIAVIGFLWDVSWHIDYGRDDFLFTPAHTMILVGLWLLVVAAAVSTVLATVNRADVGLQLRKMRIPYSALGLGVLGVGALFGFPLDELWHRAYGVDVTLWGPTHLLMIGGASFSPIALWLMLTEAGPEANNSGFARARQALIAGAVLLGLSTFQGEFDFGVPQFQQLYHPVLISLAAGIGLVAARQAMGRWGAVKAVAMFVFSRIALALLLGQALNHVIPRFPLYLGGALLVEAVWHLGRNLRPLNRALIAGALVGTVGLATEWAWTNVAGWHPWNATLFPGVVIAALIAVPAAIVGLAIGRGLSFRDSATSRGILLASGVAIVAFLVLPFPRNDVDARAMVETQSAGPGAVTVKVTTDPDLGDTDWAEVLSWQGGHMDAIALEETSPGTYETTAPSPVGGEWKTMVRFARKDMLVAAPVFLPKDPQIGASEVSVEPLRETNLVRDTELLLREATEGPSWPALVSYLGIGLVAFAWLSALTFAFNRINSGARLGSDKAAGSNVTTRRAPSVA